MSARLYPLWAKIIAMLLPTMTPESQLNQSDHSRAQLQALDALADSVEYYVQQTRTPSANCQTWLQLGDVKRRLALDRARIGLSRESEEFRSALEDVIETYQTACDRCDDDKDALLGLGDSYSSLHRFEDAISIYEIVALKDPGDVKVAVGLAHLNEWSENWEGAAHWYDIVVRLDSSESGHHLSYANALDHLGRHQEASEQRRLYRESGNRISPEMDLGRYMELVRVLRINETLGEVRVLREKGRHQEVVELYLNAARRVEEKEADPYFRREAAILSRQLVLAGARYHKRHRP